MRFHILTLLLLSVACDIPAAKNPLSQVSRALPHVLDPLGSDEFKVAIDVLRQNALVGDGWYIQSMAPNEPDKTPDGMYPSFIEVDRKVFAVLVNLERQEKIECVIDLKKRSIDSKRPIAHGEPALLFVEQARAKMAIAKDERVIKAIEARSLKIEGLHIEPWGAGDLSHEKDIDLSHRFLRATFYYRNGAINPYARPIEGISVLYDATTQQVLNFVDTGIVPMQTKAHDFFKTAQKPADPPRGFSNTHPHINISGQQVEWRGWKFRFQVHPREGLVIYDVQRRNGLVYESVMERGSLSEMVVPYADPDNLWHWKSAFDEGEYGIGVNGNSLQRGVHFPIDGLTFASQYASEAGDVVKIDNSVAIFEKSDLIWSHYDFDTNTQGGRMGKELVVRSFFTVGNYDYGLNWIFREDSSIEVQVMLTGVLLGKGSAIKKCARCETMARISSLARTGDQFGTVIDQNVVAIAHQHFFNFRLDMAVAGGKNSLAELTTQRVDPAENPYGNAYVIKDRVLKTEAEATNNVDHKNAMKWWVFNRARVNSLGHFAGYVLEPGKTSEFFGADSAAVLRRAPFLKHNFHATKFNSREMHAAGDYPSQSEGDGIPKWVSDESIYNEDLTLWYTVGVTHLPCAEESPVMSIHRGGFTLTPKGFHESSPVVVLEEE